MKIHTTILLAGLAIFGVAAPVRAADLFLTSDNCMACHNGLHTAKGEDVSIGFDWRGTMMAHSARDPYWQASVRREVREHAPAGASIEQECSICHMPMANLQARSEGGVGQVFANLAAQARGPRPLAAQDGVSCTLCHQIGPDKLGSRESFVGGFVIPLDGGHPRKALGPFEIKPAVARVMASATNFLPAAAPHVRSSELCATCHTLITEALGPDGKPVGRLPEQVPYLEWQASMYRDSAPCATCHMPGLREPVRIANLLADPRPDFARHQFLGGNFLVPTMLKLQGGAVGAWSQDLDRAVFRTREHLAKEAAHLTLGEVQIQDGALVCSISVENPTGHKLPTAYPSRRVWLHVSVKDGDGSTVFESGAITASGKIVGNDNDEDPRRFEPHHRVLEKPDQVQIYEAILGDGAGRVTTGLLAATGYLKDNRLLPSGFDKHKAAAEIAVHGDALLDQDFADGGDRVAVRIAVNPAKAPFKVVAELLYQPIGYRWADNLRAVEGSEPRLFVRAYDALATASSQLLARAERGQ